MSWPSKIFFKKTKRYYKEINFTLLFFFGYCLSLPFISPTLTQLMPSLWQCQYRRIFHKDCIYCGLTHDFQNILSGNIFALRNSLSLFLFILCIFYIMSRILLLILNKKISLRIIFIDFITAISSIFIFIILSIIRYCTFF